MSFRIQPHILEMVKMGAKYHGIGYHKYLNWLIEEGVKDEAKYYGWYTLATRLKTTGLTEAQRLEVHRLMNIAGRNASQTKS